MYFKAKGNKILSSAFTWFGTIKLSVLVMCPVSNNWGLGQNFPKGQIILLLLIGGFLVPLFESSSPSFSLWLNSRLDGPLV